MMKKSTNAKLMFHSCLSICFCVCETFVFWRRINVKTFGARFFIAILFLLFCQSRLLFSQRVVKDCAYYVDNRGNSLNQALSRRGIHTLVTSAIIILAFY